MRILVTGGAGFIGSHLVEHFQGRAEVRVLDAEGNDVARRNIIGGFRLTEHAGKQLEQARQSGEAITTQKLLQKLSYDPDLVWPRRSRAIAKAVFVVCYILVNFFGSALSPTKMLRDCSNNSSMPSLPAPDTD